MGSLSSSQRRRMYASSLEVRRNKSRSTKEFRYDGYDWRNATEERDMGVCQVTGELVHPAHDHARAGEGDGRGGARRAARGGEGGARGGERTGLRTRDDRGGEEATMTLHNHMEVGDSCFSSML